MNQRPEQILAQRHLDRAIERFREILTGGWEGLNITSASIYQEAQRSLKVLGRGDLPYKALTVALDAHALLVTQPDGWNRRSRRRLRARRFRRAQRNRHARRNRASSHLTSPRLRRLQGDPSRIHQLKKPYNSYETP